MTATTPIARPGLTGRQAAVLTAVALGQMPSTTGEIAETTRLSVSTVRATLRRLADRGLVERAGVTIIGGGGATWRATRYGERLA